jgi:predicted dehydrogenase
MKQCAVVVGLGQVGLCYEDDERMRALYPYPTHAAVYAAHPLSELVAGCDPNSQRRETFKARYPKARVYASVAEMLSRETVDVASVCVPDGEQIGCVASLIDGGVQAILVEKPFGVSVAEARRLIEAALRQNVLLAVNYWRAFDPSHQNVRGLLLNSAIGKLQTARGLYGNGARRNASHVLHYWWQCLGEIEAVWARPTEQDQPLIGLRFRSGLTATLAPVDFRYYRLLEMDFVGSAGRITITDEGLCIRRYAVESNAAVSDAFQLSEPQNLPSTVGMGLWHAIEALLQRRVEACRLSVSGALHTLQLLEAIDDALRLQGEISVAIVSCVGGSHT